MDKLRKFIKQGWAHARTKLNEEGFELPHAYVPPCINGGFRVLFYWDTYFTNLGLIADGYTNWAKENINTLIFALDKFGCVPNCVRKNGATWCSQPPLLGLMIKDVFNATNDSRWLEKAILALEKEYTFWMSERITPIGLNQHGCNQKDVKKLCEYFDYASNRIKLDKTLSTDKKAQIARNLIAEAESGEDYTPRYKNHDALSYVQIDLNSHLYGVELFLYEYYSDKNAEKSEFYLNCKRKRLELIEKYCFNYERRYKLCSRYRRKILQG